MFHLHFKETLTVMKWLQSLRWNAGERIYIRDYEGVAEPFYRNQQGVLLAVVEKTENNLLWVEFKENITLCLIKFSRIKSKQFYLQFLYLVLLFSYYWKIYFGGYYGTRKTETHIGRTIRKDFNRNWQYGGFSLKIKTNKERFRGTN